MPWIIRGKSKGSLTGNGECRALDRSWNKKGVITRKWRVLCLGSFVEKIRGHKQEMESAVPWIVRGKVSIVINRKWRVPCLESFVEK